MSRWFGVFALSIGVGMPAFHPPPATSQALLDLERVLRSARRRAAETGQVHFLVFAKGFGVPDSISGHLDSNRDADFDPTVDRRVAGLELRLTFERAPLWIAVHPTGRGTFSSPYRDQHGFVTIAPCCVRGMGCPHDRPGDLLIWDPAARRCLCVDLDLPGFRVARAMWLYDAPPDDGAWEFLIRTGGDFLEGLRGP